VALLTIRLPFPSIVAMAVAMMTGSGAFAEVASNSYPAALNYTVNCSGCHMADGSGFPGRVPSFRGNLARYLTVPEGRAYVVRVPGSANSLLSNRNLAEVLNWAVHAYDPEHLPANFVPYEEQEVARLRREPLSAGSAVRARVLALLDHGTSAQAVPVSTAGSEATPAEVKAAEAKPLPAPAAFAICAACHPVSPTGEHSIGPNLRGVVGRVAGTAPKFSYSKAMRESGITWTKSELESYLTNAAAKVPGGLMAFNGLPEANDRQAIIDYLATLQSP
jgi:cytochrome c2/mono/diheme cytochrome c family protein